MTVDRARALLRDLLIAPRIPKEIRQRASRILRQPPAARWTGEPSKTATRSCC